MRVPGPYGHYPLVLFAVRNNTSMILLVELAWQGLDGRGTERRLLEANQMEYTSYVPTFSTPWPPSASVVRIRVWDTDRPDRPPLRLFYSIKSGNVLTLFCPSVGSSYTCPPLSLAMTTQHGAVRKHDDQQKTHWRT